MNKNNLRSSDTTNQVFTNKQRFAYINLTRLLLYVISCINDTKAR